MNQVAKRPRFQVCSEGPRGMQTVEMRPSASLRFGVPAVRPDHVVSDSEIVQLVSAALNDAMTALRHKNPEISLGLRASEARDAIREMLPGLKRERVNAEEAAKEYRKAIAFQNIEIDLAHELISSIRRCAQVCERDNGSPTPPHQI